MRGYGAVERGIEFGTLPRRPELEDQAARARDRDHGRRWRADGLRPRLTMRNS
ncbi:MAG: hypothetical protein ACLFU0_07205 [Alphaproteobacteria bacterium]